MACSTLALDLLTTELFSRTPVNPLGVPLTACIINMHYLHKMEQSRRYMPGYICPTLLVVSYALTKEHYQFYDLLQQV